MNALTMLRRLRSDCTGAAMVEFAILGPAMIGMMLGVLQVGIAMQNYNALRNASADVARYAMIQYSTGNTPSNSQLRGIALSKAQGAPYLLLGTSLDATVADAATQRVTGATEKTITMTYQITTLFDAMGLTGPYITFSRPMFVTTPTST